MSLYGGGGRLQGEGARAGRAGGLAVRRARRSMADNAKLLLMKQLKDIPHLRATIAAFQQNPISEQTAILLIKKVQSAA